MLSYLETNPLYTCEVWLAWCSQDYVSKKIKSSMCLMWLILNVTLSSSCEYFN